MQNRDPAYFRHVLNFLRTRAYSFGADFIKTQGDLLPLEHQRIADEFDYFGLPWCRDDERLSKLMHDAVSRPVGQHGYIATAIACTTACRFSTIAEMLEN